MHKSTVTNLNKGITLLAIIAMGVTFIAGVRDNDCSLCLQCLGGYLLYLPAGGMLEQLARIGDRLDKTNLD